MTQNRSSIWLSWRCNKTKREEKNSSVSTVLTQLSHGWKTSHNRLNRDSGWQIKAKKKNQNRLETKKTLQFGKKKLQEKRLLETNFPCIFSFSFSQSNDQNHRRNTKVCWIKSNCFNAILCRLSFPIGYHWWCLWVILNIFMSNVKVLEPLWRYQLLNKFIPGR